MKRFVFVIQIPKKLYIYANVQKQSPRADILNMYSAALQQIYRRTPTQKYNFKKVTMKSNFFEEHI